MSRPLTRLRDATRQAEAGDLTVRADAAEGPAEVREVASAFNDMVARLDLLVGTQEKFVADASHQLRSPLTALRLRIENLQHDVSPGVADQLEGAIGEVNRLSRLVNGLLSLARADRRSPVRSRQDVGRLVAERADAWRVAAAEGEVDISEDAGAACGSCSRPGRSSRCSTTSSPTRSTPPAGDGGTAGAARPGDVVVRCPTTGPAWTEAASRPSTASGAGARTGAGRGSAWRSSRGWSRPTAVR